MDSSCYRTARLGALLWDGDRTPAECEDRVDVASDSVQTQELGDLADELRERHACIQRKIASVRLAMGLPEAALDLDERSGDGAELHHRPGWTAGL